VGAATWPGDGRDGQPGGHRSQHGGGQRPPGFRPAAGGGGPDCGTGRSRGRRRRPVRELDGGQPDAAIDRQLGDLDISAAARPALLDGMASPATRPSCCGSSWWPRDSARIRSTRWAGIAGFHRGVGLDYRAGPAGGGKLVFTGDHHQLASVGAGGLLELLDQAASSERSPPQSMPWSKDEQSGLRCPCCRERAVDRTRLVLTGLSVPRFVMGPPGGCWAPRLAPPGAGRGSLPDASGMEACWGGRTW
jgi:hypothetical protein